jgi:hypothetical protein
MGKSKNKKSKRMAREQSGRHVRKNLLIKTTERETKNKKWKQEE